MMGHSCSRTRRQFPVRDRLEMKQNRTHRKADGVEEFKDGLGRRLVVRLERLLKNLNHGRNHALERSL